MSVVCSLCVVGHTIDFAARGANVSNVDVWCSVVVVVVCVCVCVCVCVPVGRGAVPCVYRMHENVCVPRAFGTLHTDEHHAVCPRL